MGTQRSGIFSLVGKWGGLGGSIRADLEEWLVLHSGGYVPKAVDKAEGRVCLLKAVDQFRSRVRWNNGRLGGKIG